MKKINRITLLLVLFVLLAWGTTLILLFYDNEEGVGQIGQFGDMFGATNALFSGLAFVGIIVAIIIQSEELGLQRKELIETKNIFDQQSKQLKFQQRENTFFNLLSHHSKIIEGITVKRDEGSGSEKNVYILNGYRAFLSIWSTTKSNLVYSQRELNGTKVFSSNWLNSEHPWKIISKQDTYRQIYNSVIHILGFIDEYLDNKQFYYKCLFNNLSREEREIVSLLNEYHEYFDAIKIDFHSYTLDFSTKINHLEWFVDVNKLPPLVKIDIDRVKIPKKGGKLGISNTNGSITFENSVKLLEMGIIKNFNRLKICKTFNHEFKKYQVKQFRLNKEDINILYDHYRFDNYLVNPEIYFTMLYRGEEYTSTCSVAINEFTQGVIDISFH